MREPEPPNEEQDLLDLLDNDDLTLSNAVKKQIREAVEACLY